jgi:polyisoprenoid-binding protein YceI
MTTRRERLVRTIVRTPAAALLGFAILFAASPAAALAAPETYKIDPDHTNLGFKIRHFFSKVPGRFNTFEGTIALDRADLAKGSVEITIDAASIDTNEPARDKHLRSADFFDVEKHPKITFKSTKAEKVAQDRLKVSGTLTIRGVSKPVILDVDVLGFGPGYGFRGAFEARTTINRQDFGVAWNDVVEGGGAVLGNDVEIVLNVEAVRQEPKPAAPKTGR